MNRRRRKRMRKPNRRHNPNQGEKRSSWSTVVIIICLSIAAGYFTAAYLIGPMLGFDTAPLVFNREAEEKTTDQKDIGDDIEPDETEGLAESGYVLQYGSFSSREAAEICVEDLEKSGIQAEITEKDGAFKVVSPLFDTEQEARLKMEDQKNVTDVFITHFP